MRQQVLQSRPPASTDWDPCTVPQDHLISTQGGFQLAYAIDLHDGRPVDTRKPARIEAGLQRGKRLAQQITLWADVQTRVVIVRADPIDVPGRNHELAGSGRDYQPFRMARQQRREPLRQIRSLCQAEQFTDTSHRDLESSDVERFYEVIERMRFERADREVIVRGDKHHGWHAVSVSLRVTFQLS